MIVRRRTWLYRLPGERAIHSICFKLPMTTAQAREALRRSVGMPTEPVSYTHLRAHET